MTPIAPHMSAFLREYLPQQKGASAEWHLDKRKRLKKLGEGWPG